MKRWGLLVAAVVLAGLAGLAGCGSTSTPSVRQRSIPTTTGMALTSPAFHTGMPLPVRFTCDGRDVSPPLGIAGVPAGTQELAIVLHDESAHDFLHWVVFAVPPDVVLIREGEIPPNALQAMTNYGTARYMGPCPGHGGRHHYAYSLFAEPTRLDLQPGSDGRVAVAKIEAGASAETSLRATYRRR